MDIWIANFIWFLLLMTVIGWFVPKIFWRSEDNVFNSVVLCFLFSFGAMALIGTILALLVYCFEAAFLKSLFSDVWGGLVFSLERGFETGVGWLSAIILKIISLAYKDVKSKRG